MASAFVDFYEKLCSSKCEVQPVSLLAGVEQAGPIPAFCKDGARTALKQIKRNRRADCRGTVGGMLIAGGEALLDVLTRLCNDLLEPGAEPPVTWQHAIIK
eukprot:3123685-Pyramimonas_sp.AAC.1